MKRILTFLFLICSLAAFAQTNPQYNSVRFVGSDSTSGTVTQNGTLRVDPTSGNLRFRKGGTWTGFGTGSGSGTPAGSNTYVQYNNSGAFGAEAAFTYDASTNTLDADVVTVDDAAYDATGWNGSVQVPTKNAVRDKVETLADLSTAQTLTNKRLTPRVQSVTSSATVTPDADANDAVKITAQATGLTLANPSGTPVAMQIMLIRIKDNGTVRSIAYGTQYRAVGVSLPTATYASKIMYLSMIWNADDSKWDVTGYNSEL